MLKGKKIFLRSLKITDLDFLYKIENNKNLWQYGGEQKYFSREVLTKYIINSSQEISLAKQYRYVVDLASSPVGFIDLYNYNISNAGLGIIIDEKYRMNGYAKESLELIIKYSFEFLHLDSLYCMVQNTNIASVKLFKSCNFIPDVEKDNIIKFILIKK